jgi:hypothetical protein
MLSIGTLKSFNSTDYRAEVQLAGSVAAYLDNIPVARNIASDQMEVGRHVILAIPGGNPKDACVIAVWDAAAGGGGGGGGGAATFLDLTDTPSSYSGQAEKFTKVKSDESALEFSAIDKRLYAITTTNIYCCWSNRVSDTPRTATVQGIADDVITLTGNHAYRFGEWVAGRMEPDNVLLKIQNTTRSEFAWIKGTPAANQLQVTNAPDISGWQNGDTISTDQGGDAGSNAIELDISPLIPEGATAVFVSIDFDDSGGAAQVGVSTNGIGGTWLWAKGGTTKGGTSHPFCPIDADRHISVCDKASGVDTLRMNVKCGAYIA